VPFIRRHHLMFQHDNAQPHVARFCTQYLEAENVPVLPWPAYSPDMSPIEHVWDALDRHVQRNVPVHTNIAIEKLDNISQATTNSLIHSMRRCCAARGKCWSQQILTAFLIHTPPLFKVSVTNRCISVFPVM
jgi:transposase